MSRCTVKADVQVNVKQLDKRAQLPLKQTEGAACFDLCTIEPLYIPSNRTGAVATRVRTGLAFEIPQGYHMKVFLRSSIGAKTTLRLANQTGIIDSDYRGEVMLLVENIGNAPVRVAEGARIAQCLIEKNTPTAFVFGDTLSDTERGDGGFGSTGNV